MSLSKVVFPVPGGPLTEKIPQLSKMRSSSQQEKYIKEIATRKNRFKKLNQDVKL